MADQQDNQQGWMSDVQRALALILIVTLAVSVLLSVVRLVWWGDIDAVTDLTKTTIGAIINMGLIALGFFFGNTVAQRDTNRGQQNILERLAPPPAPAPAPAPVSAWWTELTEDEKNAISAEAVQDTRVHAVMLAMTSGSATADDLAYLVSKNLLTADRAEAIKGA